MKKLSAKRRRAIVFKLMFCITIICISIILSVSNILKVNAKLKEKKELTKELEEKKEEEVILTDDVEKLKDPEYAARYAREKYLYSKNGEKILKID